MIILDPNTFETIHSHQLGPQECAMSIISCKLGDDPQVYYAVGTAKLQTDESEAKLVIVSYLPISSVVLEIVRNVADIFCVMFLGNI